MHLNSSLQTISPLYVDRRIRPTYPQTKPLVDQLADNYKSKSKQLIKKKQSKIHVQNLNFKSIQWHIRNTYLMKQRHKQLLINYFCKRNQQISLLKFRNKRTKQQQILILKQVLVDLLNDRKKLYQLFKHKCYKCQNTIQKENRHKQAQEIGEVTQMTSFDCEDCLAIFTKCFIGEDSKQIQYDSVIESIANQNGPIEINTRNKKARVSINLLQKKSEINQGSMSRKMDTVTVLDSILDINLFKIFTKKKLNTEKSLKNYQNNCSKTITEQQAQKVSARSSNRSKKSYFNEQNKSQIKKQQNVFQNLLQKNLKRISQGDRFYNIIREALKTKQNVRQNTQFSKISSSEQTNGLKPSSQLYKDVNHKNQVPKKQSQQASQGYVEQYDNNKKKINYCKLNKVRSNLDRIKSKKLNSNLSRLSRVQKDKSPTQSHQSHAGRNRSKIKTDLQKNIYKMKKNSNPKNKKRNVTYGKIYQKKNKYSQQKYEAMRMNRSNKISKGQMNKSNKLQKNMTGRQKMNSLRKIKKRQAFLKKNKDKSIPLSFVTSSSQSSSILVLDKNNISFQQTISIHNKLTKYEAARRNFRIKYYNDIKNTHSSRSNIQNKKSLEIVKKKKASISNILNVPQNGHKRRRSSLRNRELTLELGEYDNLVSKQQKIVSNCYLKSGMNNISSSQVIENIQRMLDKQQFNLKQTKEIIELYLNKYKQSAQVFELLKFYRFMEKDLETKLKQLRQIESPDTIALQNNIEKVDIQNFMQKLQIRPQQYETVEYRKQNVKNQDFKKLQYQQRFITKLNNGVIDLFSWNQDLGNIDQQLEILSQISLKQIQQITT